MAPNIEDRLTEPPAQEDRPPADRGAVRERTQRLAARARRRRRARRIDRFLEQEAWPQVPATVLGQRISRAERETILGYGPEGV